MAQYVILGKFTDQGIRGVKDTAKRAQAFRKTAESMGARVKDIYWTLGHYDVVTTLEAPNDDTIASLLMKVGSLGNLKSETLRAFGEREIDSILGRV